MLGFPGDFENLEKIVQKYIPNAELKFTKTNAMGKDSVYDLYFIQLKESENDNVGNLQTEGEGKA